MRHQATMIRRIVQLVVDLVWTPLNGLIAFLLSKTNIETTSLEQWEWQRKQAEKGYLDRKRSISDAEIEHIKDSLRQP